MKALASVSLAVLCGVFFGCPTVPNGALVASVQIAEGNLLPPGCRPLGKIEGIDEDRWTPGGPLRGKALRDLKQKAVLAGGNEVIIDSEGEPRETDYAPAYRLEGRLFSCPPATSQNVANDSPAPAHTATPAPARVCEPECSPGYTCLRGTCVSACNPVCEGGERCGADRICHGAAPPVVPTASPAPPPSASASASPSASVSPAPSVSPSASPSASPKAPPVKP